MGKIIAIANQKGGVGKTTTSINLAASLGVLDRTVLIIDADPQANTTSGLGLDPASVEVSIYECMTGASRIEDAIVPAGSPNLSIIPSHLNLVGAEIELVSMPKREYILKRELQKIKDKFDYIIIDCSPSLGIITLNALTGSDSIIVPVQCEYFALEGLGKLLNTVSIVQKRLNPALAIEGILLTMYDGRLRLSKDVEAEVRRLFKDKVFKTIIHRNIRLSEAPSFGRSVIMHDLKSKGAVNHINLAREVIQNASAKKEAKTEA